MLLLLPIRLLLHLLSGILQRLAISLGRLLVVLRCCSHLLCKICLRFFRILVLFGLPSPARIPSRHLLFLLFRLILLVFCSVVGSELLVSFLLSRLFIYICLLLCRLGRPVPVFAVLGSLEYTVASFCRSLSHFVLFFPLLFCFYCVFSLDI